MKAQKYFQATGRMPKKRSNCPIQKNKNERLKTKPVNIAAEAAYLVLLLVWWSIFITKSTRITKQWNEVKGINTYWTVTARFVQEKSASLTSYRGVSCLIECILVVIAFRNEKFDLRLNTDTHFGFTSN